MGTKRHHLTRGFNSFLILLAMVILQTPTIFAQPFSATSIKPGLEKFAVVLPDALWIVKNGKVSHIANGWIVQVKVKARMTLDEQAYQQGYVKGHTFDSVKSSKALIG